MVQNSLKLSKDLPKIAEIYENLAPELAPAKNFSSGRAGAETPGSGLWSESGEPAPVHPY